MATVTGPLNAGSSQPAAATPGAAKPPTPGPARRPWWRTVPSSLRATTTPGQLRSLLALLIVLCVGWGVVAAWTVDLHASAAGNVVTTSEPLSLDAQQVYQSLSDADVTVATAFLAGPQVPLAAQHRFDADIARASAGLKKATTASGNSKVSADLATLSAGLPVYTSEVASAQLYNSLGYLAGSSYMQVAAEQMQLTLLPAARSIYAQENSHLTAASAQATGLPLVVVAVVVALVLGYVLFRGQRWLARRTHRIVNYGLLAASIAGVVSLLWLATAFTVARIDLGRALSRGSQPAETLAEAGIASQRARGDEILNLISHSGDTVFQQDFAAAQRSLGPGPGTLLTTAASQAPGSPGVVRINAAARAATAWYKVNQQVHALDAKDNFPAEAKLVTGTGPGTAATLFAEINADLTAAMTDDEATFRSSVATGRDAFTGLEAGTIVLALVMAAGCWWGISRRLAEYR